MSIVAPVVPQLPGDCDQGKLCLFVTVWRLTLDTKVDTETVEMEENDILNCSGDKVASWLWFRLRQMARLVVQLGLMVQGGGG